MEQTESTCFVTSKKCQWEIYCFRVFTKANQNQNVFISLLGFFALNMVLLIFWFMSVLKNEKPKYKPTQKMDRNKMFKQLRYERKSHVN